MELIHSNGSKQKPQGQNPKDDMSQSMDWNRVFVIEDDLSLNSLLDRILRQVDPDVEIEWTTSAEDAIHHLKEQAEFLGNHPYDLLIVDVFLEGKVTGLDLWRLTRDVYPKVPLIIISGLPVDQFLSVIGRGNETPPFLAKPLSVSESKRVISEQLKRNTQSTPSQA